MITIVIPVYNSEDCLQKLFDSFLQQTIMDFEVIMVDDGSKDNSGRLCDLQALKDSRFKVIHKINGGVSSARNTGIAAASGDYITFCDSDDTLTPTALQTYQRVIDAFHPDIIRAAYRKIMYNGEERIYTTGREEFITKDVEEAFVLSEESEYFGFLWNSCYSATFAKSHFMDESISWCEDHLYYCDCLHDVHSVAFTNDVVYNYNVGNPHLIGCGDSLSLRKMDYRTILSIADKEYEARMRLYKKNPKVKQFAADCYKSKAWNAVYFALWDWKLLVAWNIVDKYFDGDRKTFVLLLKIVLKAKLASLKCCKQSSVSK